MTFFLQLYLLALVKDIVLFYVTCLAKTKVKTLSLLTYLSKASCIRMPFL